MYRNSRTGFESEDLTELVDASATGDAISYGGHPFGIVHDDKSIEMTW